MLSIDFHSRLDEEQLQSFTQWLTPWQSWLIQSMLVTDSKMLCSLLIVLCGAPSRSFWQWRVVQLWPA